MSKKNWKEHRDFCKYMTPKDISITAILTSGSSTTVQINTHDIIGNLNKKIKEWAAIFLEADPHCMRVSLVYEERLLEYGSVRDARLHNGSEVTVVVIYEDPEATSAGMPSLVDSSSDDD